jgi:hypothetical protein
VNFNSQFALILAHFFQLFWRYFLKGYQNAKLFDRHWPISDSANRSGTYVESYSGVRSLPMKGSANHIERERRTVFLVNYIFLFGLKESCQALVMGKPITFQAYFFKSSMSKCYVQPKVASSRPPPEALSPFLATNQHSCHF